MLRSANKVIGSAEQRFNLQIFRSLHGPPKVNEYSEKSLYPPISNFASKDEKKRWKAKESIKTLQTVEEKMYQINRPKYYGWFSYLLQPDTISVDSLDFTQFSTWTHVVKGMPSYYADSALDSKAAKILDEIGPVLEQVVRDELCHRQHSTSVSNDRIPFRELYAKGESMISPLGKENITSKNLIHKIHQVIHRHLSQSEEHIKNSDEDYDSRNEAFWFRGGIGPDKSMIRKREGTKKMMNKKRDLELRKEFIPELTDEWVNRAYERAFQIHHKPVLQIRHADPLQEFVGREHELSTNVSVPIFDYDPRVLGLRTKCQHGTNIPGFWPEADENQLGLLSYHTRVNRYNARCLGRANVLNDEVLREQDICKGILTNFGWLLPQACYLGFSPMTEMTFPLVSQSVNTDGQTWSFFAYQMNTCDLTTNEPSEHTHQNIIWTQEPQTLYSKVEGGKLVGFDPASLKTLIKMYLNKPKARNYDIAPYLGEVGRLVDFPDDYQRGRFMEIVKAQTSNREKTIKKPEIYLWEKLLLIDNQAPPQIGLARRRRWWHQYKIDSLGKENWHPEFINTDEKKDLYVPKGMRPEWTRKGKLNKRYNKFKPKIRVPLQEKIAMYEVPKTKFDWDKDESRR